MKLVKTKTNIGHGVTTAGISWNCHVCGKSTSETEADIFNMPGMPNVGEKGKEAGVHVWMCGNCLAKALETGKLVLYHNPDAETPPADMELPVEVAGESASEESAFEVSW